MTAQEPFDLELIATLILELDQLICGLPSQLTPLRSLEARELAISLPMQSQAIRLAVNLDLAPDRLSPSVGELQQNLARLERLPHGTRVPGHTKVAISLGERLADRLMAALLPPPDLPSSPAL